MNLKLNEIEAVLLCKALIFYRKELQNLKNGLIPELYYEVDQIEEAREELYNKIMKL